VDTHGIWPQELALVRINFTRHFTFKYLHACVGNVTVTGNSFRTSASVGGCYYVTVTGNSMTETGTYTLPDYGYASTCPTGYIQPQSNTCGPNPAVPATATYSCTLTRSASTSTGGMAPSSTGLNGAVGSASTTVAVATVAIAAIAALLL